MDHRAVYRGALEEVYLNTVIQNPNLKESSKKTKIR
jgi:hypothetical protein